MEQINRKTPNFDTQLFFQKRDLICVKEFAYGSPKFLTGTFLNADIQKLHPNFKFHSAALFK